MKSIEISMFAAACLITTAASAVEMPPLAKKDTCTDCHAIDRKIVGPAWMDISRRYKGASEFEYKGKKYPLVDGLVMKISKGGFGNWGPMPMPINDPTGAKEADYRELVHFILNLSNQ
jgi:cytochrome c